MFDDALLLGDSATALNEPSSMLLSEETALKFFDAPQEAMDKQFTIGEDDYKVTGILASDLQGGGA